METSSQSVHDTHSNCDLTLKMVSKSFLPAYGLPHWNGMSSEFAINDEHMRPKTCVIICNFEFHP